ncbi:MFS transporter [Desulfurococcaceae archaeon AG1]|nr:MAG: MFS transporter [Desulfurococcaceae archaeon]GAY24979.1 MFS transporter [Desulfurococcaceae archaeon AG1]
MKNLKIYSILNNLANGLGNPFVGFFAVSSGLSVYFVSLISSASTALPGVSQIAILKLKSNPKALAIMGTLFSGILWILAGIAATLGPLFVGLYLTTQLAAGIASLGWTLILERISRGKRGMELARYSFYANIGSLTATLLTGYVVGRNLNNMGYFFIASGALMILSSLSLLSYKHEEEYRGTETTSTSTTRIAPSINALRAFYLVNASYMVVMSLAWPLFPLAQVYKFEMGAAEVGLLTVIAGVSTLILQRIVGVLVDFNRKIVMFSGRLLLAVFPLGYALSSNVYELYLIQLVAGYTNSAVIAYTAYVMDHSIDKRKALSLYSFFNGVATVIGSVIGGALYTYISTLEDPVSSIDTLMLAIGIIRILLSIPYLYIKDIARYR